MRRPDEGPLGSPLGHQPNVSERVVESGSTVAQGTSRLAVHIDLSDIKVANDPGAGYFLVSEDFARKHCHLDAFVRRQRERSDEARRANDGLIERYPTATRRFLIQRTTVGTLCILSEHLVAIDPEKNLLVLGPVPVAGRFKQEEVRAQRRVMLAVAGVDPRFRDLDVIALTTPASSGWRDNEILEQMRYAETGRLTRDGISWLAAATRGAEIQVFQQLDNRQIEARASRQPDASLANNGRATRFGVKLSSKRTFLLRFWARTR